MDFPWKYKQLWSYWDVRVFILLSLNIQIILIFLGRMRRTFNSRWIRMIVWSCYLLADLVAIFVLGQLSNSMDDSSSSNAIIAFWAPFLILHLSGPDTITAYSVEDNELWARHLLWLIYHLSVAFYVLFRSLPNTRLLAPTLLIFLVAIIKYLERSYSLYRASIKGFGNSLFSYVPTIPVIKDYEDLSKSFWLYNHSKGAFIDALPDEFDYEKIRDFTGGSEEILKVLSVVLSYAYDEFYTKAIIIHSKAGYVLRVLCSICISLAFSLFYITQKDVFKHVDVAITYVLLSASICLDLVATVMLVFSDRMVISLLNDEMLSNWKVLLAELILFIKRAFHKRNYRLRKMPQINLFINLCRIYREDEAPRWKIMWVREMLTLVQGIKVFRPWSFNLPSLRLYLQFESMQSIQATDELIKIIASCLRSRYLNLSRDQFKESVGFFAFQEVRSIVQSDVQKLVHLFAGLSVDQHVLVWHITTDLCLYQPMIEGVEIKSREENEISSEIKACRLLSNYMMYMVLNQSDMRGESSTVFRKLFNDLMPIGNNIPLMNVEQLGKIIMNTQIDQTNDNLVVISRVLASLMFVITEGEKWKVMKTIWVELLIRKAKDLRASSHVKQLSKGDDLLTLIWLFYKNVEMDEEDIVHPSIYSVSIDQIKEAEDLLSKIKLNMRVSSTV